MVNGSEEAAANPPPLELPPPPPPPPPQLYPAAQAGDAEQLRLLRDEGVDLFETDGEVSALAHAAEAGALEALGVFLGAAPPQGHLDDGLAAALRGGHRPCAEALLVAGASPLGVFVLEEAVRASAAGDPAPLLLCLGALAARGRDALREDFLRDHYSFHHAVSEAARTDTLGPLAALLEFGRWAVGAGPPFEGPPPELLRFSASGAFLGAAIIGAEAWDAAGWAPVARLLITRGGADLQVALACLSPRPPQALEERQARIRAAWGAAEPPRWGAAEEAALDAAVAPALLELGALLAGADAGAGAGAGGPAGA
jgi:hypothetical protein